MEMHHQELQTRSFQMEMEAYIASVAEFVRVEVLLVSIQAVAWLQRMAVLCLIAEHLKVDNELLQNKWLSLSQLNQAKEADAETKDASDLENDDEDDDDDEDGGDDDDDDEEEYSEDDGSDNDGDPDNDAEANGDGGSDEDDDDDDDDEDEDDDDDEDDEDEDDDDDGEQPPPKKKK